MEEEIRRDNDKFLDSEVQLQQVSSAAALRKKKENIYMYFH